MKSPSVPRTELTAGKFEFTQHALRRVVERDVGNAELREAGERAVTIEDYPDDKYGSSCQLPVASCWALHWMADRCIFRFRGVPQAGC